MKFKSIITLCLAGFSFAGFAQTHLEGVEYYKADQFNNALELLERNINNPGTDKAVANYYLGLLSIKQKDLNGAKAYFDNGIAANPDYAYNYIGLGSLALRNGQAKEAGEYFKKAEKLNKKDAAVYVGVARAYYESSPEGGVKYAKEIEKAFKNAQKQNMTEPEIFILEGDMALDAGDRNTAAAKYDMATTYNPQAAGAYVKYASLYQKLNPQYAIQMLQKLLQQNPQSALGQRELANAYYNNGNIKDATEQYAKYVQNPSHFKSDESQYSFLLYYNGDYQGGYDYATKLLKEDPTNFEAMRYQFLNASQIPEMAESMYTLAENLMAAKKTSEHNTFAPIDYVLLSDLLSRNEKTDEALALLEEGMKAYPDYTRLQQNLSYVYFDMGDYDKAADTLNAYIKSISDASNNDILEQVRFNYIAGTDQNRLPTDEVAAKYLNQALESAELLTQRLDNNYIVWKWLGDVKIAMAPDNASKLKAAVPEFTRAMELADPEKNQKDYERFKLYLGGK